MTKEITISDSYRASRKIAIKSGSNFSRAFWLLPKRKRASMYSLYAFARTTDDLGDSHDHVDLRTSRLSWWREVTQLNLKEVLASDKSHDAEYQKPIEVIQYPRVDPELAERARVIFPALRDTAIQFSIPPRYFLEIIDGVMADQQKTRFDTYEQVEHYCYLVASAVGLACLHIWEFHGDLPLQSAIDCGIAFQLTNILRDVVEDSERGRIYLPRQHYELHGLSEDDLLTPRRDDRLRCLILDEVARAEQLYESGWQVWSSLHPDGRKIFSMMWRTYRSLLDQIAEDPMRVVSDRVKLSFRQQCQIAIHHFVPTLFQRLPIPPIEMQSGRESGS